jgi:hypothetical protein
MVFLTPIAAVCNKMRFTGWSSVAWNTLTVFSQYTIYADCVALQPFLCQSYRSFSNNGNQCLQTIFQF